MAQFAEATNEYGEVMTSSPGPSPAATHRRWSPAVPLETAAAYGAPTASANDSSKRSIVGPSESRPERRTSATSSSSRSSSQGELSPTCRVVALTGRSSARERGGVWGTGRFPALSERRGLAWGNLVSVSPSLANASRRRALLTRARAPSRRRRASRSSGRRSRSPPRDMPSAAPMSPARPRSPCRRSTARASPPRQCRP